MENDEQGLGVAAQQQEIAKHFCGIIMPISDSEGYDSGHWGQVRSILSEAIRDADYEPRIVSDGNNSSIIHARIVTNIYQDDIVVCDVSSLNSNVMLEFGLRLASKKPLVVIKDSTTKYSFDASPIEYVQYPTRLDYYGVNAFKEKLVTAIKNAVAAEKRDDYKSFLDHFSIPNLQLNTVENSEVGLKEYLSTMEGRLISELSPKNYRNSNVAKTKLSSNLLKTVNDKAPIFANDIEDFIEGYLASTIDIHRNNQDSEKFLDPIIQAVFDWDNAREQPYGVANNPMEKMRRLIYGCVIKYKITH